MRRAAGYALPLIVPTMASVLPGSELMPAQGSHMLTSMLGANALVVVEPGTSEIPADGRAFALLLGPVEP